MTELLKHFQESIVHKNKMTSTRVIVVCLMFTLTHSACLNRVKTRQYYNTRFNYYSGNVLADRELMFSVSRTDSIQMIRTTNSEVTLRIKDELGNGEYIEINSTGDTIAHGKFKGQLKAEKHRNQVERINRPDRFVNVSLKYRTLSRCGVWRISDTAKKQMSTVNYEACDCK